MVPTSASPALSVRSSPRNHPSAVLVQASAESPPVFPAGATLLSSLSMRAIMSPSSLTSPSLTSSSASSSTSSLLSSSSSSRNLLTLSLAVPGASSMAETHESANGTREEAGGAHSSFFLGSPCDANESTDGASEPSASQANGGTSVRNAAAATSVPLFVMLPLDVVSRDGSIRNPRALAAALQALKSAGVQGVMVDVWWGVVEREGPRRYDWSPYQQILKMAKRAGLLLQAVMSFHACGNNVGDTTYIPLPRWVRDCAESDPAIFFTDSSNKANPECISLFSDTVPCLLDRTPLEVYEDFMVGFRAAMGEDFGSTVKEVAIGMGPCGELRYPAYPEGDGRWRFPGVGEFQCYDARALADLRRAAQAHGQPRWGLAGPHDAGQYNSRPHQTGFFAAAGSWQSEYGHFFLQWYSDALIQHGERMLQVTLRAFHDVDPAHWVDESARWEPPPDGVQISLKCAGIHWWYGSASHAAELTAGYYNPRGRNGYAAILAMCARYGAHFNFTCCEMRNCEQPPEAHCAPQELLNQVRVCAAHYGVPFAGENALARLDQWAYDQMLLNTCSTQVTLDEVDESGAIQKVSYDLPSMAALTYLRLSPQLFEDHNFTRFMAFVRALKQQGSPKLSSANLPPTSRGGYANNRSSRPAPAHHPYLPFHHHHEPQPALPFYKSASAKDVDRQKHTLVQHISHPGLSSHNSEGSRF